MTWVTWKTPVHVSSCRLCKNVYMKLLRENFTRFFFRLIQALALIHLPKFQEHYDWNRTKNENDIDVQGYINLGTRYTIYFEYEYDTHLDIIPDLDAVLNGGYTETLAHTTFGYLSRRFTLESTNFQNFRELTSPLYKWILSKTKK